MLTGSTSASALPLERRVGQTLMVGFDGTEPSREVKELIERYGVGGIILFSRNLRDAHQTLALTHDLQAIARQAGHPAPLLIATDQENGMVRRLGRDATALAGSMALGATGDPLLAYDVALATGRELRAVGINMNLAPVADVNNNPRNPVIGVRSFGDDPGRVARMVAAAARGYADAGIVATLKHFPGHGDTQVDLHLALAALPYPVERLEAVELPPFAAGIAAGAPCVMTAHLALPALTGSDDQPATLSPGVLRGLLRERMGFDGVVITDCLEMRAIADTVGVARGAVLALAAGADLVLISHTYERQRAAFDMLLAAVRSGELNGDALTAAAERVLALKRQYLAWEALPGEFGLADVGLPAHRHLQARAYARTMTLVRDRGGLIPLRLSQLERVLVVSRPGAHVSEAVDFPYQHEYLVARIRERHANTAGLTLSESREADQAALDEQVTAADLVLVATINAHLDPPQAALMRRTLASGKRVIGLALCDPYDLMTYPAVGTYLALYEYTEPALDAAVAVLFGERSAVGQLPVTLPGIERT